MRQAGGETGGYSHGYVHTSVRETVSSKYDIPPLLSCWQPATKKAVHGLSFQYKQRKKRLTSSFPPPTHHYPLSLSPLWRLLSHLSRPRCLPRPPHQRHQHSRIPLMIPCSSTRTPKAKTSSSTTSCPTPPPASRTTTSAPAVLQHLSTRALNTGKRQHRNGGECPSRRPKHSLKNLRRSESNANAKRSSRSISSISSSRSSVCGNPSSCLFVAHHRPSTHPRRGGRRNLCRAAGPEKVSVGRAPGPAHQNQLVFRWLARAMPSKNEARRPHRRLDWPFAVVPQAKARHGSSDQQGCSKGPPEATRSVLSRLLPVA